MNRILPFAILAAACGGAETATHTTADPGRAESPPTAVRPDVSTEVGEVADWLVAERAANRVAVVVVDVETGEVIGSAGRGPLGDGEVERAVDSASTIKTFTIAAALAAGLDPERSFETDDGEWHSADLTLQDWSPRASHDARAVLVYSSNVGAANVVSEVGAEKVRALLTGLALPAGTADEWSGTEGIRRAAHGIDITPTEWARAYVAIAKGRDGVLTPELAAQVRDMLESAVREEEGTGHPAAVEGLRVAGKTGTSDLGDGRGCWFVGMAPADQPRWVAAVYAETADGHGGSVAAPAFAQLARRLEAR